jgi:thiol-disulfide isomerase/thioredoxin
MTAIALALLMGVPSAARPPAKAEIVPTEVKALQEIIRKPAAPAVLVNVWASWCQPCVEEMPDIIRFFRKHKERGLRLVLVSADFDEGRADAERFLAKVGVDFRSYQKVGDDMAFIDALDKRWSGELPASFLYDGKGAVRFFWPGKVSPQDLEHALEELLGNKKRR